MSQSDSKRRQNPVQLLNELTVGMRTAGLRSDSFVGRTHTQLTQALEYVLLLRNASNTIVTKELVKKILINANL